MRSSHWNFVHQGKEVTELGTVPIGPDGSFSVEVPADVPIALQAVDAEGRSELNQMSWIYVRPGEKRSCTGGHEPRRGTPPVESPLAESQRAPPLKLLGQGEPHRWRGHNSGVSGMMDVQFERFREVASLNRYRDTGASLEPGREETSAWVEKLDSADEETRICPPPPPPGAARRGWLSEHPWPKLEATLVGRIDSEDCGEQRRAIVALGHIGGDAARAALRQYVAREKDHNPYPRFTGGNRTDSFTFHADSPLNPRTLQAAPRALGLLNDTERKTSC